MYATRLDDIAQIYDTWDSVLISVPHTQQGRYRGNKEGGHMYTLSINTVTEEGEVGYSGMHLMKLPKEFPTEGGNSSD